MKPIVELAQVIREHRLTFTEKYRPLKYHLRSLRAIERCRTAALGGHLDQCSDCSYKRISYNSCRNRHCPKCQNTNKERWIMAREDDLLPTSYFHVVFTIPSELNAYCLKFPKDLYGLLMDCSRQTLVLFANDPKHWGAELGSISLLHTWGQNLSLHPHVHIIVPGIAPTNDNRWIIPKKSNGKFLFPVKQLSVVFRGKFMEALRKVLKEKNTALKKTEIEALYQKGWVVYAKAPFGGPKQVVEYLGRYSHKVAISNHRIKGLEEGKVTFSYKDYADGSKQKLMRLEAEEFLRRFCLHILPPGFMKIRHYGFLSSRGKKKLKLQQMILGMPVAKKENQKQKPDWKQITKTRLGFDVEACPCCTTGKMKRVLSFDSHAPPPELLASLILHTN